VYWSYRTAAGVRSAMSVDPVEVAGRQRQVVFFGNLKTNAYAIDAQTGAAIWRTRVDASFATRITAAPAL
jgi:polyvinyl alcohol dehydrogenase (cytochrome)